MKRRPRSATLQPQGVSGTYKLRNIMQDIIYFDYLY